MYALLSQNQNYGFERKNESKIHSDNKKIDNWNIEMEKKIERLNNFNPEVIFLLSDESSIVIDNIKSKQQLNETFSFLAQRRLDTFTSAQLRAKEKGNFVLQKMNCYKLIIQWLDMATIIFIIISTLIIQVENLYFYELNLELRTTAIKIVNNILTKNFTRYNDTDVDNMFKIPNYYSTIKFDDYESVYLNLEVDDYSKTLRETVLIFSIISAILIIISRWSEYVRNYIYKKNEIPFYKTTLFRKLLFELVLVMIIPYPKMSSYLLYIEYGHPIIIPISSIFAVSSMLRVYFLTKLIKHLTCWTSTLSEYVCEKFVCEANTTFAFKAYQKENPFIMLFFIFILSCYCFGVGVRTFELYYWENFSPMEQHWNYQWNAMWFVFVSMTTVGYGDFYPKTQFGRIISLLACLVGIYFVSIMMVFMTKRSLKNEEEEKAYKLITRLKYRNKMRNLYSTIIYNYFQLIQLKNKKRLELIDDIEFDKLSKYKRRCILNEIHSINDYKKLIKSCDFIPTKEQLYDISEKLDSDIKGIREELDAMKNINDSFKMFTDEQLEIVDYIRKNIYAGKLLGDEVKKSKKFGQFNSLNLQKYIQGVEITNEDISENISREMRRKTNPLQFGEKSFLAKIDEIVTAECSKNNDLDEEDDLLAEIKFDEKRIRMYFDFMFSTKRNNAKKLTKTRMISGRVIERSHTRRDQLKKRMEKLNRKNVTSFTESPQSSPKLFNTKF